MFYISGVHSVPINASLIQNTNKGGSYDGHGPLLDPKNDGENICEEKVFLITSSNRVGGSGRSDLVTFLKNKFDRFGLPLSFSETMFSRY